MALGASRADYSTTCKGKYENIRIIHDSHVYKSKVHVTQFFFLYLISVLRRFQNCAWCKCAACPGRRVTLYN